MIIDIPEKLDSAELVQYLKSISNFQSDTKEIERKWLCKNSSLDMLREKAKKGNIRIQKVLIINQSYLSIDPELRIRRSAYESGRKHYLSYKDNGGLVRTEIEVEISYKQYCQFKGEIAIKMGIEDIPIEIPIATTKYYMQAVTSGSPYIFEISECSDPHLCYAEIEFPSVEEANAFVLPEIFQNLIISEVTGNAEYNMKNLWYNYRFKAK